MINIRSYRKSISLTLLVGLILTFLPWNCGMMMSEKQDNMHSDVIMSCCEAPSDGSGDMMNHTASQSMAADNSHDCNCFIMQDKVPVKATPATNAGFLLLLINALIAGLFTILKARTDTANLSVSEIPVNDHSPPLFKQHCVYRN